MDLHWEILQEPDMIARLALQVLLFAASAIFSMSETALFSLRETDLQRIDNARPAQSRRIRTLLEEPRQLIVSILCGNELINIAATVNLAGILLALFGNPGAAAIANTVIMLPLLLILGEITPKTLAVTQPQAMSTRVVEPVISPWVRIVMPLRAVVRVAADALTGLIVGREEAKKNLLSTDEFKTLLDDVGDQGIVNPVERRIILNLIAASDWPVTQIMVPRPRIVYADASAPVPETLELFRTARHRRLPVFRGTRDNVIGVLKPERVIEVVAAKPVEAITIDDLLEPATMAPTTVTVSELAEFFKDGDHHGVLLVNEFGGIEGMVTADDVFGFLISGEAAHLENHSGVAEVDDVLTCAGLTPVRALRGRTPFPLPEHAGVTTIGGLVLSLLGTVPEPGDMVRESGLTFRVEAMDGLLIDRLTIARSDHAIFSRAKADE